MPQIPKFTEDKSENYERALQYMLNTLQEENEKFAMRVYLNRIGFIGPEYKNYREHLYKHLDGSAAWRYGYNNPKYKKNKNKEEKIA